MRKFMSAFSVSKVCLTLFLIISSLSLAKEKPLMREFMGINGHLTFKPELYSPTTSLVRNYHPMLWDVMDDTSYKPKFPHSRQAILNGPVDWSKVYGSWKKEGYEIDACLQFDPIKVNAWKNLEQDAEAYAEAFAKAFGPSSNHHLVTSAEIGNEPAEYNDKDYRRVFESMAKGLRKGDPKIKVVTAASAAGKPDKYSKSVNCFKGLENFYDVLNIHTYSMIEGWPTWRRVHPEHPKISYLEVVEEMINWRNAHAAGKEIWITEFGYDASTKPAPSSGTFSKWVSSTETEQAQWLVRSFLIFSAMDVDRAYLYYYDDKDEPSFHASSGITRNFTPKQAYYAIAHLKKTLGDYRFSRAVVQSKDDLYVYEYVNSTKPDELIWVAWLPTGSQKESAKKISIDGKIQRTERMPLKKDSAESVPWQAVPGGIEINVTESPVFIWLKK